MVLGPRKLRQPVEPEPRLPDLGSAVYWLAGLLIVLTPLFVGRIGLRSDRLLDYLSYTANLDNTGAFLTSDLGRGAASIVGAPASALDSAGLLAQGLSMFSALIAPLFILGLGALIANADTLTGWTLASWFALGSALAIILTRPLAPQWSTLVVAWPSMAMAAAFAIDRLRASITESTGEWTLQATLYLAAGLVIGAAALGFLGFYENGMLHVDEGSALAREARHANRAGDTPIVVRQQPLSPDEAEMAAFLTATTLGEAEEMWRPMDELPQVVTARTRLIVPAGQQASMNYVRSLYPNGDLVVHRDLRGNPVVYTYVVNP